MQEKDFSDSDQSFEEEDPVLDSLEEGFSKLVALLAELKDLLGIVLGKLSD